MNFGHSAWWLVLFEMHAGSCFMHAEAHSVSASFHLILSIWHLVVYLLSYRRSFKNTAATLYTSRIACSPRSRWKLWAVKDDKIFIWKFMRHCGCIRAHDILTSFFVGSGRLCCRRIEIASEMFSFWTCRYTLFFESSLSLIFAFVSSDTSAPQPASLCMAYTTTTVEQLYMVN